MLDVRCTSRTLQDGRHYTQFANLRPTFANLVPTCRPELATPHPAPAMALTKRDVDRLKHDPVGPATQIHYDGDDRDSVPGFGVRIFPSGVKSFVVWYRTESGRKRLHTIGRFGPLTIDQARKKARELIGDATAGADPLAERRQKREAETVRDLGRLYIERHAKPHKKTWKEDERRLRSYVYPAFGALKVADVKRSDVARLHSRLGASKPYEANRVLALVQVVFNKAVDFGVLDDSAPNPAARIQKFKEQSRDRWVTPAELPALWEAIEEEQNPYIQAAFKCYLFTGMRRSELLGLRWKDIDFDRRVIRLEDTKAGRPHVVPLSEPAEAVLRELPRQVGNAFVFAGAKEGRPLVNVAKPWKRIRERAGLEDVRLHDLRRTVGSWLASSGASLPLIGKVLNHSNASTTQVYARLAEDAPRAALEEHAARILELPIGSAGANP